MSTKTRRKSRTLRQRPNQAASAARPLPKRTPTPRPSREFITEPAMNAAYAARLAGLPLVPITAWALEDTGAMVTFPSGARLVHHPAADTPFTALTPCNSGFHHSHPITTSADLHCTSRHGNPTVLPLPEGRHRADQATAETQRLSTDEIAAGLTDRAAADLEQPKGHPAQ